jgi:hypothetical protein
MPLRFLQYYVELSKKLVDGKSLYREALIRIPKPEFIVLYNGRVDAPDRWEEHLSDVFMETEGDTKIPLDLTVTVYNINKGRNEELLSRSKTLAGYAEFVAQVRENQKAALSLEESVTGAVRHCVERGILAPFLEEHGAEVTKMLLREWDWDVAKEVWQEEAREAGREEDRNQILELINQGYTIEQLKAKLTEGLQDRS